MGKNRLIIAVVGIFSLTLFLMSLNKAEKPVVGLDIGNKAPEIEQMNPEGKKIKLSSLKGKMVLIDFWASWCRPCRLENPTVVAAFEKYKDKKFKKGKGFRVYSVSLDENADAWKRAIEVDKLNWTEHVSDLKGWKSAAAATYEVHSIPTNFLINGEGIILSKKLRGPALEAELAKNLTE
jgi:thiol-disulfide isomerase/thioredoxin